MLNKTYRTPYRRKGLIGGSKARMTPGWSFLFLAEFTAVIWSYAAFRKINRDLEFRYQVYKSNYFSWAVETYYKTAEFMDSDSKIREIDRKIWTEQGKEV